MKDFPSCELKTYSNVLFYFSPYLPLYKFLNKLESCRQSLKDFQADQKDEKQDPFEDSFSIVQKKKRIYQINRAEISCFGRTFQKSQNKNFFLNESLKFPINKQNNYPQNEELKKTSQDLQEKFSKIENWFKQRRRKDVQIGKMAFEVFF